MASTDTRSGFRLPWISDAHPAESAASGEPEETEESAELAASVEPSAMASADPGQPASLEATAVRAPVRAGLAEAPAPRRPTKFLADLARAMRAAAEAERQDILERFQAEAKAYVETIHERSGVEATELRGAADHDIAGIREWSKAEIARIREETERRISDRRSRLDGEIDAHAARIERRIERVHGTVGSFEADMARFFETLLAEEDPTRFAELASNLPEPPSLEAIAASADDEPYVAVAVAVAVAETVAEAEPAAEPMAEAETAEVVAEAEVAASETPAAGWPAEAEPAEAATPETAEPVEVAAPETAEPVEVATAETAAEPVAEAAPEPEPAASETPATGWPAEADASPVPLAAAPAHAPAFGDDEDLHLDPRVAALGLTPDFDAAEAEAAAALATDLPDDGSGEEVPAIDDETLAARLAGLVPTGAPETSVATRVVVGGLVSVASIAGFKRGLGRLPGVHSVSVSSGPDGEFVFAVAHAPDASLPDAITTMPGFAARVTGTSDGTIHVVARDPDASA